MRRWPIFGLILLACGSPGGDEVLDASPVDAAPVDAAPADAAPPDGVPCDVELPCPAPGPANQSVCGRIYDVETTAPLAHGEGVPAVEVFGPAPTPTLPDSCARYQFLDIAVPPAAPIIGVGVDDTGGADVYAQAGVAETVAKGNVYRLPAFAARHTTDLGWTEAAGSPFGPGETFIEHGAILVIAVDTTRPPVGPLPGAPVAGVVPSTPGETAFYFADEDPLSRTIVDPSLVQTGANGSMLITDRSLAVLSLTGPAGCVFAAPDAASVAGWLYVMVVQGECP